ncbi:MAG: Ig-like domain-containing protein, partial [Microvirga sp.]
MVRSARTSLPLRAIAIVALALAACGGSSRRASAPTPAAGAPQDTGTPSDGPTSTDGMVTPPAAPTPPTGVTPLTPIVPLTPPAPPAAPAPPPTLVAVELLPATAQVPVGLTLQVSLTGTHSDGSTHDLPAQAAWSSSEAACAPRSTAVGDEGLASGVQAGTTTLRATYGGLDATATLEVTSATLQSIAVSTATPAVALGRAVQFRALGHLSDQTDVDVTTSATWGSDQTSVATISSAPGAHGLATTLSVGTAGVTATLSGLQSAPVTLTVEPAVPDSIAISP